MKSRSFSPSWPPHTQQSRFAAILIFSLLPACLPGALAQPVRTLSLPQSIDYALDNSAQIRKAKIDRRALEERLREARGAAYPQITAGLNYDYYPMLPVQYLPGALLGRAEDAYVPAAFGQPWQMSTSLQVQQPLYNESLRRSTPAANVSRTLLDLLVERSTDEVR
ncbi:MAG TPA: TolC family protein, partial [Saprospiraceae bacterium]|nr:TolC family protein [Saprospiraceae bacterium]